MEYWKMKLKTKPDFLNRAIQIRFRMKDTFSVIFFH